MMLLESKSSFFTRVSGSIFSPENTPEDETSQSLWKRNIKQESVYTQPGNTCLKKLQNQIQPHPDRNSGSEQGSLLNRQSLTYPPALPHRRKFHKASFWTVLLLKDSSLNSTSPHSSAFPPRRAVNSILRKRQIYYRYRTIQISNKWGD